MNFTEVCIDDLGHYAPTFEFEYLAEWESGFKTISLFEPKDHAGGKVENLTL